MIIVLLLISASAFAETANGIANINDPIIQDTFQTAVSNSQTLISNQDVPLNSKTSSDSENSSFNTESVASPATNYRIITNYSFITNREIIYQKVKYSGSIKIMNLQLGSSLFFTGAIITAGSFFYNI